MMKRKSSEDTIICEELQVNLTQCDYTHGKEVASHCRSPKPGSKSAEARRLSSAATSRLSRWTKTDWLDEADPPGCSDPLSSAVGCLQTGESTCMLGDQCSPSLVRPAMQAAQWFSCSLRQRPGSSSPALRAAFECPSDPCGTPAPLGGGTSSSSPAPADSSAQNWSNSLVISQACIAC